MSGEVITQGSEVTLHYTLSLATGKLAETTRESGPATLVAGSGELLPAFECRLIGLSAGDKRRFEIKCLEAYGPAETDNVHVLARSEFPPDMKLEPGLVISFETPAGDEAPGVVREVSASEVTVDFAHPLAGHDLVFEVEILAVKPPRAA
jgi:FKBP-type peptidyl-prolyl cis-trans isomerase SlpA